MLAQYSVIVHWLNWLNLIFQSNDSTKKWSLLCKNKQKLRKQIILLASVSMLQLDQLRLIRWRANRAHQRSSVYICSKHPHCCYIYVSPNLNLNLTLSPTPTEEWVQRETPSYRGKLSKLERTLAQRQPSQSGEKLDMGLKVHIFRQAHLEKNYSVHMKGATNRRKPWFRYTADQSQWAWMSDCSRKLQKWSKRCGVYFRLWVICASPGFSPGR